jgi:hypothetical protein
MPRSSRPGKVSEEFILPQEKPPGGDENCSLVAQCKEDYARVSTDDQDTAVQVAALKAAGCERIYREKGSGGRWDRPELHRLLDQLRKGDVLVVWKLDRLSRSLRDVLTIMERLGEAGAGFRSLTEAIDTTTPAGRMMMQMVGPFAEFERAMLRERTKAGLDAAREEGRIGGRRSQSGSLQPSTTGQVLASAEVSRGGQGRQGRSSSGQITWIGRLPRTPLKKNRGTATTKRPSVVQ